ncbi:MAG: ComF family protein [Leptospirillum sp.]
MFDREARQMPASRSTASGCTVQGVFRYQGISRDIFHMVKFSGHRSLGDFLISRGLERIPAMEKVSLWVPVPPDHGRLLQRGLSIPDRLAWRLSRLTDIPCHLDGEPPLPGSEQKSMSRHLRAQRYAGRWGKALWNRAGKKISGVVIVDDLVTTGETLSSFESSLVDQGATVLYAVALFDAPLRLEEEV